MPELPEVETYRLYLEATSLEQKITEVTAQDARRQVTMPFPDFREHLIGRKFVRTYRIGKHLLVELDNGTILSLHFGMTGDLHYYRLPEDAPRFERATFYFDSGFKLAFVDSRKFGRLGLWESVEAYRRAKTLGPDALGITAATLQEKLKKRKGPIKPVLLDQKVLAGIGNWLADEILFQAKLHPEMPVNSLSPKHLKKLTGAINEVLETTIAQEAIYRNLPVSFLIHSREWDTSPYPEKNAHLHCPRCQTPIRKTTVGGRATYLCDNCQPEFAS